LGAVLLIREQPGGKFRCGCHDVCAPFMVPAEDASRLSE
jgi:hypothetical protein